MKELHERNRFVWRSLSMKVLGIALCMVCVAGSPGYALWVGQSQINPFLEVRGEYQSNIYRMEDDEESDFITVISPGIHFEYPTTQNPAIQAVLDYRADIRIYGNDGDSSIDPDSELNTVDQRLGGHVQYNLASGWLFKGGYALSITSNPPDFIGDTRNDYKQHDLLVLAGYNFADRYKIEFQYDGAFRSYDDSEFEVDDIDTHEIKLVGFYRIQPKVSVLLGGDYVTFSRQEPFYDSTEYRGYTGIEYEATESTTGTMKVGAARREFDTDDIDDATDFYVNGEIRSEYAENSFWSLKVFRDYHDSTVSDQTAYNGAYYMTTGFGGTITHALATLPNLSLSANVLLSQDAYPEDNDDREDNKIRGEFGIAYKFYKFVSLGAGYRYDNRDSNIDGLTYTNHSAFMSIKGLM
ncbi:hypothetical protein CSA56_13145 [candidate division KSB3 bacterium]|uniref:Uncharacterized protein n=1 Tax=candidate division KSB3 bacterium TaxID=2044937 RepID=A0A2G6KBW1_9BACT|nr:MAG: hypothetical protein CSA56_13145 [candidate division KSB3 bacterium]